MKKVVRRGVFETNSSSSHSLTLIAVGSVEDKVLNRTFEITETDAKIAMLLALIGECEDSYQGSIRYLSDSFNDTELLFKIVDKINEYDSSLLAKYDKITVPVLADVLINCDVDIMPIFEAEDGYSSYDHEFYLSLLLTQKNRYRYVVIKYKDFVISEYAKSIGKTIDEALKIIYYEGNDYNPIKGFLLDMSTAEEKLTRFSDKNPKFKKKYLESGITSIIDYAKVYLLEDFKKFKMPKTLCFNCTRYFGEGALYDCDCGFATYHEIVSELDIDFGMTDEAIREQALKFISKEYKFVANEDY